MRRERGETRVLGWLSQGRVQFHDVHLPPLGGRLRHCAPTHSLSPVRGRSLAERREERRGEAGPTAPSTWRAGLSFVGAAFGKCRPIVHVHYSRLYRPPLQGEWSRTGVKSAARGGVLLKYGSSTVQCVLMDLRSCLSLSFRGAAHLTHAADLEPKGPIAKVGIGLPIRGVQREAEADSRHLGGVERLSLDHAPLT